MTVEPAIGSAKAQPRPAATDVARLCELAQRVRIAALHMVVGSTGGHPGASLSCADILVALYFTELDIRPAEPAWQGRDRYVHSKGHASEALYATLAFRGYFPESELSSFGQLDSRLQGHPDMTRLPGVDMSTGALGVGFSASIGMAIGSKVRGTDERTYVLLGDGECQEGSVWEAVWVAARYHLDNLVAIVDFNSVQQIGWPGREPGTREAPWDLEPFKAQWAAAGWAVLETDGHDIAAIVASLAAARAVRDRPVVIVARTVKGKGVSFMEGSAAWHSRMPTTDELTIALEELGARR